MFALFSPDKLSKDRDIFQCDPFLAAVCIALVRGLRKTLELLTSSQADVLGNTSGTSVANTKVLI
tara:strand:- start:247 stop:441 length:195 start_codon:yes stop_codon:yes gene_type:complete